jgi:Flp pilus assembly protein TadD
LSIKSRSLLALSLAIFLLAACSKKNTAVERVAILPANILVSDNSAPWLKIGVPLVLQQDLMTARNLIPGVALDESSASQAKATQILRTTVESRQSGLRIEATLVDAKTQKSVLVKNVDAPSVAAILPALNDLARKIDSNAYAYPTGNVDALQSYLGAATTNNRQQRGKSLTQAIQKDATFSLAYIALLEMLGSAPPAGAAHFIDEAKAHRDKFAPYDRAKLDLAISRLSGAPAQDQIKLAQEALKFAPNDLDVLAVLGLNQFLEGDAKAGEESLRRAVSLNPANTALQIQLGRGLMQSRKFKEADAIFSAAGQVPAVLPDLATCVLLEGDTTRANTIADKFFSSIQNPDLKPLLRASWLVMERQASKGVDMLLSAKFTSPNIQSVALSEVAVWQVLGHDYAAAQATVQRSSTATTGQAISFPAVAALLADKDGSAADWQKRVAASPLPPNVKDPIIAYGLFLRGNYAEAATQWRQTLDKSHGADLRARAMLASSLAYAGKKSDADAVKVVPFVPEFGDLYAAIPFLEMRRVLGI